LLTPLRHSLHASLCLSFHCSSANRDLPSFPTRRSSDLEEAGIDDRCVVELRVRVSSGEGGHRRFHHRGIAEPGVAIAGRKGARQDRKSTRLNSSHVSISYAVFCLKKKKKNKQLTTRTVP